MFSKEDSKKIREEFWISFGKSFPRKWILYNTKIRDFSFKFYFDTKIAMVILAIECVDIEKRMYYYEKLVSLKSILKNEYLPEVIFEEDYYLDNGKEISRIFVLKEEVSIHNKKSWQETMIFLEKNMLLFEDFFREYEDFIKS
ncbi:DUF4268 domain-containing protein [Ascidiimonas sp. W6]|uniref:DUF4268 domain-containing protein n=1 Tax=Ascidiimonas meishanensis TaxID=3128903 RepID=UPI0030EE0B5E